MTQLRLNLFGAFAGVTLIAGLPLEATTITVTNAGTTAPTFVTSSGSPVPNASLIRVGFFDNLEDNINTVRNGTWAEVEALFNEVGTASAAAGSGSGTIQTNNAIGAGRTFGQISGVNDGDRYVPANYTAADMNVYTTKMVLWATNDTSGGTPTEYGIFMATGNGWDIPASSLAALTMNPGNVVVDALRGTVNGDGNLQLEVIPEPAIPMLVGVGLVIMLFRRRWS